LALYRKIAAAHGHKIFGNNPYGEPAMPNDLAHFAIHADDCQRAKAFYEAVFGWTFEPWGPPDFWLIHTSPDAPTLGALQKRHAPVTGTGTIGFECTIGVDDVRETAQAIEKHGGTLTMQPMLLETVGTLVMFKDTEQNVVGAMQYLEGVR